MGKYGARPSVFRSPVMDEVIRRDDMRRRKRERFGDDAYRRLNEFLPPSQKLVEEHARMRKLLAWLMSGGDVYVRKANKRW